MDPNTVASTPQQGIELFRNGKSAGELILAIRMEAPDQAKAIMATSTSCPLKLGLWKWAVVRENVVTTLVQCSGCTKYPTTK